MAWQKKISQFCFGHFLSRPFSCFRLFLFDKCRSHGYCIAGRSVSAKVMMVIISLLLESKSLGCKISRQDPPRWQQDYCSKYCTRTTVTPRRHLCFKKCRTLDAGNSNGKLCVGKWTASWPGVLIESARCRLFRIKSLNGNRGLDLEARWPDILTSDPRTSSRKG